MLALTPVSTLRLYSTHLHPHNKLIIPETMKLLPLLILGLQKSALLKGAREVNTDDRANVLFQLMMMPLESVMTLLYPKCYPLLDLSMVQLQAAEGAGAGGGQGAGGAGSGGPCLVPGSLPPTLPLTLNSIRDKGIYLFDNGLEMYIWIGRQISPKWLVDVFGVGENPSPQDLLALDVHSGGEQKNATSAKVFAIVTHLRSRSPFHQNCTVVRQGDPMEAQILPWLVEDKGQSVYSYTNYLGYIHKCCLTRTN